MAKSLAASLLFLSGVADALTRNPQSQTLKSRQDFCGTDQYDIDWYCVYEDTECCVGSVQGLCMPAGYQCCDTGFYCGPDEECYRDEYTQFCVSTGDSSAEATRTAESKSVGETSAPGEEGGGETPSGKGRKSGKGKKGGTAGGGDDGDDDDDDDDEPNAAVNVMGSKVLLLLPLLGALAALM